MATTGAPLTVEYALDREDYWRFNRFVYDRSPKFRLSRLFERYFIFLLALVLNVNALRPMMARSAFLFVVGAVVALGCAAALGALFFLGSRWYRRHRVVRLLAEGGAFTAPCALTIGPGGIACRGALSEGTMAWSAVTAIAEDERHAFFFVDNPMAVVVPAHAFATGADYRAFVDAARAYWRAGPAPRAA